MKASGRSLITGGTWDFVSSGGSREGASYGGREGVVRGKSQRSWAAWGSEGPIADRAREQSWRALDVPHMSPSSRGNIY